MIHRSILMIFLKSMVLCQLIITQSSADVLSSNQKAPPFARGSGGLVLPLPLEGVPRVAVSQPAGNNAGDGVQRQEMTSFKKIGDETIIVVEGSLAYNSPEGLPVSVNFKADENGNRASFKIGTGGSKSGGGGPNKGGGGPNKGGGGGGGGPNKGGGGGGPNKGGGGGGPNKGGGGGGPNKGGGGPSKGGSGPNKGGSGPGGSTYLPPNKNGKTEDRSYLPPS